MSESFRYLINVDQCLNISNYDMFFYKLKDQRRFRFFETAESTLELAVDDAGQYLRRYTYETEQTQIIFAERKRADTDGGFGGTLLCRLLKARDALQKGRIDISGRGRTDRAAVLMVFHDVDFDSSWTDEDDYFQGSNRRFVRDCSTLLEEVSLNGPEDSASEALKAAAERLENGGQQDGLIAAELFREFSGELEKDLAAAGDERISVQLEEEADEDLILVKFVQFIREKLVNYVVIEQSIRRSDLRESTRAFLRLAEYINSSTEHHPEGAEHLRTDSLAERCRKNWERILQDESLEGRYAAVLSKYEKRLLSLSRELEDKKGFSKEGVSLPSRTIPADDSIKIADEQFSSGQKNTRDMSLVKDLERYRDGCLQDLSTVRNWDGSSGVYSQLSKDLQSMEKDLFSYAEKLSRAYTADIETRIKETADWDRTAYEIPEGIQTSITETQAEIDARMKKLKEPGTSASLKFQDQLNMTGALDRSSQNIQRLTERFSGFRSVFFLAVLAVSVIAFVAHYYVLQNYVLDTYTDLMLSLGYIAAVTLLCLGAWIGARKTYKQKISKEIRKLEEGIEKYLNGYFEKAGKFSQYVNLLNQLDYLKRYSGLLERVRADGAHMRQLLEWHKVQIKKHLDKVQAFHGLVQTAESDFDTDDSSELIEKLLSSGEDVVGCSVYWPQVEENR